MAADSHWDWDWAADRLFVPGGYPHLGLVGAPAWHVRDGRDSQWLKARWERRERRNGSATFEARHLDSIPTELGFEMVNVLSGLRRLCPDVTLDHVDFCEEVAEPSNTLMYAFCFPQQLPEVRGGKISRVATLERNWMLAERIVDPMASGCIRLSDVFADTDEYRELGRYWAARNMRALHRGAPHRVRHLPIVVSPAAYTLAHEWGHLVEGELLQDDVWNLAEPLAVLSGIVFGVRPHSPRQTRRHLINYPAGPAGPDGPYAGTRERQRATRQAVKNQVGLMLGGYAAWNRSEMFAEAFAISLVGEMSIRRRLAPFLLALQRAGIVGGLPGI